MGILQAAPVQAMVDAKAICCWCGETLKRAKQLNVWSPWWCFTKACYERQCAWSVTAEKKGRPTEWLFCPVPKQVEFFEEAYRLGKLALADPERGSGRVLFGGAAGPGKAVALDTIIPTPTGLTTMAALAIGDEVFDEHGASCRVTWKSDVHVDPQGTYQVTFDDGAVVIASASHEWVTWTHQERMQQHRRSAEYRAQRRARRPSRMVAGRTWVAERNSRIALAYESAPVVGATRTTADIASTLLAGERVNHAVPLAGAWAGVDAVLPIDPYVLGAWLGDGHTDAGYLTTADPEVLYEIEQAGFRVSKMRGRYLWRIEGLGRLLSAHHLRGHKHLPAIYQTASPTQRLACLQGLMDTDGCANDDGTVEFCNTNRGLADAVWQLALSLGIKARWAEGRATLYGRDCGPKYRVTWSSTCPVFRLPRKRDRLPTTSRSTQRWRYITDCRRIVDVPVQCITVDSPSHQYLVTAHGIPTHNSHALRWGLYRDAMRIPDLNCLLLRRTFKELDATHLREMMREVPRLGGRYLTADKRAVWPNGSVIQAGHCETDTDAGNHLSTEYDREVFDELVTFAMEPALEIMSRARTAKDAVKAAGGAQVWAGSNPGGRGALWVKAFFVDKSVDPAQFPKYQPERYSYVHAKLEDNPYMDPAYRQTLEEMPSLRRRQLLEGDWSAFEGQFFDFLPMKESAPWHIADMEVMP